METTELSKRDQLARFFTKLGEEDPLEAAWVWDDYCDEVRAYDSRIYAMDEFDEIMVVASDAVIAAYRGDFNPFHKFFWLDVYGNLMSADSLGESPYDPEELADFFLEREGDVEFFHAGEIDAILGTFFCA